MNSAFTAYDLATGQVQFSGTSYNPATMATESMGILLGVAHDGGWLADGVHYPQPARPSAHHTFDWTGKAWIDPRTLQDLRNAKWEALRNTRDALESTSFPYLGRDIQSDMKSVLRINTAVKAADYAQAQGAPFATQWRCLDDTLLPLDGPAMQLMPVALAAYAQSLHTHANALREQVYSAPDEAALALIAW